MRLLALATQAAVLAIAVPAAHAASAPDAGIPFEPRPASQPLYATAEPTHRQVVEAADGVDLFVETWLPAAKDGRTPPAKLPTILIMTPYARPGVQRYTTRNRAPAVDWFTQRGYAVAQHHVRGTGASGGCLEQTAEAQIDDGSRVVEWLGSAAPWSDGNVGMYGISYDAETQISIAGRGDPARTRYLKAIIPAETVGGQYEYSFMDGVPYAGQALLSNASYLLLSTESGGGHPRSLERPSCQPEVLANSGNPSGDMTPFWAIREYRPGAPNIRAATLWLHGLADWNVQPITVSGFFERLPASTPHKGLFGQYDHNYPDNHGRVAPEWARLDWLPMATAWYDRYLKGADTGVEQWPDVQVQGTDGQWRAEADYPTTGGPVGHLALGPDAVLGATAPTGETSFREGPDDMETVSGTAAVFRTPVLDQPLHLTGMPVVDLWLTTSLPDAHLAARLELIKPGESDEVTMLDSSTQVIGTHGARSLQHLDPMPENRFTQTAAKPAPTGTPIRVALRLQPADIVVPPGHQLRLIVAGTNSWARETLPSGGSSTITLLHGCEHTSALRFLMARPEGPYLNVRETDEDGATLARNPAPARVTDGGGLASAPVCGRPPERLPAFGPPLPAPQLERSTAPVCRDVEAPVARISRLRLSRRSLRLSGTAGDRNCGVAGRVTRVEVVVARRAGKRCRFLTSRGRFTRGRRCISNSGPGLRARGSAQWSITRRARLPRGTYAVWVRARDVAGNTQRGRSRGARVR